LASIEEIIDRGVEEAAAAAREGLRSPGRRKRIARRKTQGTLEKPASTARARQAPRARAVALVLTESTPPPSEPDPPPAQEGPAPAAAIEAASASLQAIERIGNVHPTEPFLVRIRRPWIEGKATEIDLGPMKAVGAPAIERDIAVVIMGEQLADEAEATPARPSFLGPEPVTAMVSRALRDQVLAAPAEQLEDASDEDIDEFTEGTLASKIRRKVAARPPADGRVRSKTIAPRRLTRDETRLSKLKLYPDDVDRPASRRDCYGLPRPCPFVTCSHHLYLDVNPQTGAIKLNFPHLEVWEMSETCSLDVADKGGITLEEVGAILNLTRERIRQVEVRGLDRIRENADEDLGLPPEHARGNDPI
jgi:hypothetical protein